MPNKKDDLDFGNLFSTFATTLEDNLGLDETLNIIDFIEQEVDLGITLTIQQTVVLKAFYNLELNDEEISILQYWKQKGKTTWDENERYQSLILESGRRSGKTSLSAVITAYEFYLLCKMPSPQRAYGIATSTPISILVLATTATQAKNTIFKTVTGVVQNTRYFQRLIQQRKIFVGKEEVSYPDKNLYVYSGNSQSGSQVGGTMKALIMDEVARFKDADGKNNALELWSNLGIATVTFGKDARRIAISSAWYEGDAIQILYEGSKSDPTRLGIQTASWDLNPIHAARDNPIVASEYATDPVGAALEFEGIRPAAVDAFLDQEEVKRAFTGKVCIRYTTKQEEVDGFLLEKIDIDHCEPRRSGTVAHIDPGITNDSYALGFGHSEFDDNNRQIVHIDGLLAWEPKHNTQVSITDVQKNILHIHKFRPIEKLTADHYNSVETIQRIRQYGISCEIQHYSNRLQLSMYDLVRVLLHENRLILPSNSPLTPKLLSELTKLQLIRGQKIDHPKEAGHSKDLADAVASICWTLAGRIRKDEVGKVFMKQVTYQAPSPDYKRKSTHPLYQQTNTSNMTPGNTVKFWKQRIGR